MLVFITIIVVTVLLIIVQALRIPQLDIPAHASKSEKLLMLDTWFQQLHQKEKFNGTVLLSKQGKLIFSKSYGLDGAEHPSQLSEHASFNLASVSKQFTAMGIVLLNNKSLLSYQDEVADYIPELAFYKGITIKHLLHHTSGLPDYMRLAGADSKKQGLLTVAKMISLYKKHKPSLNFEPGMKFQYSNAGYVLLAEIIARVSGRPFNQFMDENIFKPLNMNDTQIFNLLSESQPDQRVYGYGHKHGLFGGSKKPKDLNYFDGVAGDGAVYSSAHDLNIWHEALRDGTLVSNEIYKEAYTRGQLANGSETNYGFGWFINADGSVEHAGGWQGFTSYIYRNMEHDDLIVILDNSSNTLRVNAVGYKFNSIGLQLKDVIGLL